MFLSVPVVRCLWYIAAWLAVLYAVGGIHSRSGCGPHGLLFARGFEEGGREGGRYFYANVFVKQRTQKKIFNGVLKEGYIFSCRYPGTETWLFRCLTLGCINLVTLTEKPLLCTTPPLLSCFLLLRVLCAKGIVGEAKRATYERWWCFFFQYFLYFSGSSRMAE